MLTFGSLFSGIGGIDLGLERAGWTCKWQVEIDPFCRKVLEKHWPHVLKYGDIKELTGDELDRVDLLAGGFPCQDLSLAGKGAGLSGDRSGLWFEYLRIICTLRPRWVLVENVPGLFIRGIDTVLGGLAEAGYDATWFCLQAADFGAPHRRERVFIVAHSDGRRSRGQSGNALHEGRTTGETRETGIQETAERGNGTTVGYIEPTGKDVAHTPSIQCTTGAKEQRAIREMPENRAIMYNTNGPGKAQSREDMAHAISPRLQKSKQEWQYERSVTECGGGATKSLLGRVLDGISRGMDRYRWPAGPTEEQYEWEPLRVATGIKGRVPRLKGLGNAVVPAKAELIGWIIREVDYARCNTQTNHPGRSAGE